MNFPWPDKVVVTFGSEQVGLTRLSRGPWGRISRQTVLPCAAEEVAGQPWRAPLRALRGSISDPAWRRAGVEVVLSNAFARFGLVRVPGTEFSASESLTLAQHHFQKTFGEAATGWEFRTCLVGNTALLVSAMERALVEELKALFPAPGFRLRMIQPLLVPALNQLRSGAFGKPAWLLVVERNHLALAAFEPETLAALTLRRVETARPEAVWAALEQTLQASGFDSRRLLILAAQPFDVSALRRWEIEWVKLPAEAGVWQVPEKTGGATTEAAGKARKGAVR